MLVTKSDRISILPITNKNKLISLNDYFEKILLTKNQISNELNKDKIFQNLLFSQNKEDSKLLLGYCNKLNYPIFSSWELQKFINSDLIDKEKNRIEQFFVQYKASLFKYQFDSKTKKFKNFRFTSKLSKLIILLVKNYFYNGYLNDKINEIISSNSFFLNYRDRIFKLVNDIIDRYKFHRKPISYTTSSMIKCEQRILGLTKPRIIKDNSNTKYKYFLAFDFVNQDFKKEIINLPLAYNSSYHQDFSQYSKSLGSNKFSKGKLKKVENKIIEKKSSLNYKKINKNFEVLFEKEFQISLSKRTNRLTITLPKKVEHTLVESKITKDNTLGIDLGGSINNSLVDSNGKVIGFNHLKKLINKFNIVDNLPNKSKEERLVLLSECNKQSIACKKGNLLSSLARVNEYYINLIIKDYLNDCKVKGIEHLVFEKLDSWSVKWKRDKTLNDGAKRNSTLCGQKYNRVFRLIRQQGIVDLFKKQARNLGIVVHNIPSFYTSQMCSCCYKIDKSNLKSNRRYICQCGNILDRDINAARNIKYILERFSNKLCKKNSYNEHESIKYISKEFTKSVLLDEKVKIFSSKSCN